MTARGPRPDSTLKSVRREWEDLAAIDPYWAVLTDPCHRHGGWDRQAFLATGGEVVHKLLATARGFGLPQRQDQAVDFGCGLGRLTRGLSELFAHVCGVDVSPSLIAQATELNHDRANCQFRLLDPGGLEAMFRAESIDLVCSLLVLQHQVRRRAIRSYIRQFIRILRPGGVAIFQVPTHIPLRHRIQPRRRLYALLRGAGGSPTLLYRLGLDPVRMLDLPQSQVAETIDQSGGILLRAINDDAGGAFASATYYAGR